jgi:ubiquinone/menaquinone biosynthesis C-methylase UbiE
MMEFDKYLKKQAYHWTEAEFVSFSAFNPLLRGRYEALLQLGRQKAERVLEIGAGDGYLLGKCHQWLQSHQHVGVDRSFEGIQQAVQQFSVWNLQGVFSVSDSSALPFLSNSFDLVLFADVIEHLPDSEKAVSEICRVLKPGGTLLLSTPMKKAGKKWDSLHVHEFSPTDLTKLLAGYFPQTTLWWCWPRKWFHLWKTHRIFRLFIKLWSQFIRNPFSQRYLSDYPPDDFGQMIAQCVKG